MLPEPLAQRVWQKKVLWLTRVQPEFIARIHVADLSMKYSIQGLDLVELRAVWAALPDKFENDNDERKAQWRSKCLDRLKELVASESKGDILPQIKRNGVYRDFGDQDGPFDPNAKLISIDSQQSGAFASHDLEDMKVSPLLRHTRSHCLSGQAVCKSTTRRHSMVTLQAKPSRVAPPVRRMSSMPTGEARSLMEELSSKLKERSETGPAASPPPSFLGELQARIAKRPAVE